MNTDYINAIFQNAKKMLQSMTDDEEISYLSELTESSPEFGHTIICVDYCARHCTIRNVCTLHGNSSEWVKKCPVLDFATKCKLAGIISMEEQK